MRERGQQEIGGNAAECPRGPQVLMEGALARLRCNMQVEWFAERVSLSSHICVSIAIGDEHDVFVHVRVRFETIREVEVDQMFGPFSPLAVVLIKAGLDE